MRIHIKFTLMSSDKDSTKLDEWDAMYELQDANRGVVGSLIPRLRTLFRRELINRGLMAPGPEDKKR
jgi:hypothetical protein